MKKILFLAIFSTLFLVGPVLVFSQYYNYGYGTDAYGVNYPGYNNYYPYNNCSYYNNCYQPSCASHSYKACSGSGIYWYNSCGVKQDLVSDCGGSYYTGNTRCSGNWLQKEKIVKGCSTSNYCSQQTIWENSEYLNNSCGSYNNLEVECHATPYPANVGEQVVFYATVRNGNGNYNYNWTGDCSSSYSASCARTFNSSGSYTATVSITSNGITNSASCSAKINEQQKTLSCYNGDLYWLGSYGNRLSLYQDCGQSSCDSYGSNFCSGNAVYRYKTCYNRGCSNNSCTATSYQTSELVLACGTNQTCNSGQCISVPIVYTPPKATYYKNYSNKCSGSDIYWFDSLGKKQDLYKSCDDKNTCTTDSCSAGKCVNELKCASCEKNSTDYCKSCSYCGDGVCNCKETSSSCSKDCKPIVATVSNQIKTDSALTAVKQNWYSFKNIFSKWYVWVIIIVVLVVIVIAKYTDGGTVAIGFVLFEIVRSRVFWVLLFTALLIAVMAAGSKVFITFFNAILTQWYVWFLFLIIAIALFIRFLDKKEYFKKYKSMG